MSFLAAADATAMPAAVQAQCLQGLEEVGSIETVARASVLRAFSAGQGYCGDREFSAKTWLVHQTRASRGAAAGYMTWARRAAAHPVVAAALGEAVVSESWARVICQQTDRVAAEDRDEADAILLAAVKGGAVQYRPNKSPTGATQPKASTWFVPVFRPRFPAAPAPARLQSMRYA